MLNLSNNENEIWLNVHVLTDDGPKMVHALVDTGSTITVLPRWLNPKFIPYGYALLAGFRAHAREIRAQIGTAWISLDGKEYVKVEATITDQVDHMILSPQGLTGYSFLIKGNNLQVFASNQNNFK